MGDTSTDSGLHEFAGDHGLALHAYPGICGRDPGADISVLEAAS